MQGTQKSQTILKKKNKVGFQGACFTTSCRGTVLRRGGVAPGTDGLIGGTEPSPETRSRSAGLHNNVSVPNATQRCTSNGQDDNFVSCAFYYNNNNVSSPFLFLPARRWSAGATGQAPRPRAVSTNRQCFQTLCSRASPTGGALVYLEADEAFVE